MKYTYELFKASVISVCNNLIIDAELSDGQTVAAFCGASAIAKQCKEGSVVWLKKTSNPTRLIKYNVAYIEANGTVVFANPKYDRQLFLEAFENNVLDVFDIYDECRTLDDTDSGIDFLLSNSNGDQCYVYATSIYMKRDSYAVFPHTINFFEMKVLEELISKKKQGAEVCVFFIVPREDCLSAKFVWDVNSLASGCIYDAAQKGVNFICYGCNVNFDLIEIDHRLDVLY